jgi:hypothetical protein
MRLWISAVLLTALCASWIFACGPQCHTTSQCGTGEHCNFVTGDCIKGCVTQADCPDSKTSCDPMSGLCQIKDIGRFDSGIPTTTTSTIPDAGPRD